MAQSFAKLGYKNAQNEFQKVDVRAQDVFATNGISAEAHMTNAAIHLTTAQTELIAGAIQASQKGAANGVAPLDAGGKIPAQYIESVLADCKLIVNDYTALLALSVSEAALKTTVFVSDASGDATVGEGWAIYFRKAENGTADDWQKLMEGEGLDIDFNAFIKQTEKGTANGVATLGGDGKIPNAQIKAATTSAAGISKLNSATDSEAEDESATPKAVKTAYDAAVMLDAAYCTSETEMANKNLRVGALVMMAVDNDTVDTPAE